MSDGTVAERTCGNPAHPHFAREMERVVPRVFQREARLDRQRLEHLRQLDAARDRVEHAREERGARGHEELLGLREPSMRRSDRVVSLCPETRGLVVVPSMYSVAL